jgi:4-amino-4-deoxy-L-arabinose transferase-like glycosyltransferase
MNKLLRSHSSSGPYYQKPFSVIVNRFRNMAIKPDSFATIISVFLVLSAFIYLIGLIILSSEHVIPFSLDINTHYFPAAGSFLAGHGLESFRHDVYRGPGYPLLLVFGSMLSGNQDLHTIGRIFSLLSGIFFLFFTFSINRKLFPSSIAYFTVALVAVNPTFVLASIRPLTDIFFGALAVGCAYLLFVTKKRSILTASLAGMFSGYAYLVRYPGIFLLIFGFIALIIVREWRRAGFFVVSFVIVTTPWLIGNFFLNGNPFYTKNITNLHPSLLLFDNVGQFESILLSLQTSPIELFKVLINRILIIGPYEVVVAVVGQFFGLLALIGLILMISTSHKRKQGNNIWWLLFPIFYWFLISLVKQQETRLYIPLLPFIAGASFIPIFWLYTYVGTYSFLNTVSKPLIFIPLVIFIYYTGWSTYSDNRLRSEAVAEKYQYLLNAAEVLKNRNLDNDTKVVAFYHSRAISVFPGRVGMPVYNISSNITQLNKGDYLLFEENIASTGEINWSRREGFYSKNDESQKWKLIWEQSPDVKLFQLLRSDFIEDFEYGDLPLDRGWSMGGQSKNGEITIDYDSELLSNVLSVSSNTGVSFRADYDLIYVTGTQISFDAKLGHPCVFYIVVSTPQSGRFIINYSLDNDTPQLDKNKKAGKLPLDNDAIPEQWIKIERNIPEDLLLLVDEELINIKGILFRGNCRIDNVHIK